MLLRDINVYGVLTLLRGDVRAEGSTMAEFGEQGHNKPLKPVKEPPWLPSLAQAPTIVPLSGSFMAETRLLY